MAPLVERERERERERTQAKWWKSVERDTMKEDVRFEFMYGRDFIQGSLTKTLKVFYNYVFSRLVFNKLK